jgi:hypothetical protein
MSKLFSPTEPQAGDRSEQPSQPLASQPRRLMRYLGLLLIILAGLIAWFLIVAYLGWQSGETLLVETQEAVLAEELANQVNLAREDIEQGNYTLALRRLEWVLERAPDHAEARALQAKAEATRNDSLAPQPALLSTPTPTHPPLPTVDSSPLEDPAGELQRIHRLLDAEAWEEAVSALVVFQMSFPSHERQETDALLYDAYVQLGSELVEGDQAELGLFYLTQAEKLGDLPQAVKDYQGWAELYLQGIAFYGVNWAAAASYFRDLCLVAPFYQSSCERLVEVLVLYGDQYTAAQDWCPAQSLYEEARQYRNDSGLIQRVNQAREGCLAATPTPASPITGTLPITGSQPLTNSLFTIPPSPDE